MNFLLALSLFLYALKHSASNHGDVEIDGIYLSTREKRVCLKASQASSGSVQSRIEFQCMLPNSLFVLPNSLLKASQFAFLKFKIILLSMLLDCVKKQRQTEKDPRKSTRKVDVFQQDYYEALWEYAFGYGDPATLLASIIYNIHGYSSVLTLDWRRITKNNSEFTYIPDGKSASKVLIMYTESLSKED